MTLRDAVEADAPAIAALSIEVWVGTYLKRGVGPRFADHVLRAYTPDAMRAFLRDPAQIVIVSLNDEGPDGYVRIAPEAQGLRGHRPPT